ncbi:MAG: hypothetical protein A3I44_00505 [Candidatus Sungbacteria bacterium RIFCSPLOWO2_02_FULL_51_17]|uniref:Uncharacterized protein n=1 Tax=Candidatus Sungbacteria bacterium RIFCSPHIGHO2_02_FULL_51_29 TaxID=1802273 RepID=A0A1G2KSW6_9BACT|nr:MAG: hypothetical protein A3C16_00560 [Candidatus Sungbacteria bacterium RIFCSPHIGHO2_02_FULL_51_29]OHA12574.1 MAG: hypothetical protein A3I44_00505 [Candidatus Sungbacteria bacterium RIFCSPLOWO2_02_FULL_51_17]
MKEPKMPYVHGEPEGLGRKENPDDIEEAERVAGLPIGGSLNVPAESDTSYNDIGEDRKDEWEAMFGAPMSNLYDDFIMLPPAVQKELLEDMQTKMKRNFFKTKEGMREYLQDLIEKNLKLIERNGGVETSEKPQITYKGRRLKK